MPKTYQIITDAACDLPEDLVEQCGLAVIPMIFTMDGKEYNQYSDHHEYPADRFFDALRHGHWATTTQIPVATFEEFFTPYLEKGLDILYIGFSSGLSGTWQRACQAVELLREKYPDRHIEAVDSLTATLGQGLLVYLASQKQKEGLTLHELKAWVEVYRMCMSGWFMVDDLNHLKRGGRVSAATAFVGSMLSIKPILQIDNEGHLIVREKARGRKQALDRLFQKMETRFTDNPDLQTVFIVEADCKDDAKAMAKRIQARFKPKKIMIHTLGPVIGSHTGPGAFAIFYPAKNRD